MQIIKIFNNNVLLAEDSQEDEVIVMGRGIGFQKKSGETVDLEKIEKLFVLKENNDLLPTIYDDMSNEEIELVLDIIKLAEATLDVSFQSNLYITLADHLHFAIERHKQGLSLQNPLSWQIKKLYRPEYAVGQKALEIIENKIGVRLSEEEAASIALHLINAQK